MMFQDRAAHETGQQLAGLLFSETGYYTHHRASSSGSRKKTIPAALEVPMRLVLSRHIDIDGVVAVHCLLGGERQG